MPKQPPEGISSSLSNVDTISNHDDKHLPFYSHACSCLFRLDPRPLADRPSEMTVFNVLSENFALYIPLLPQFFLRSQFLGATGQNELLVVSHGRKIEDCENEPHARRPRSRLSGRGEDEAKTFLGSESLLSPLKSLSH